MDYQESLDERSKKPALFIVILVVKIITASRANLLLIYNYPHEEQMIFLIQHIPSAEHLLCRRRKDASV